MADNDEYSLREVFKNLDQYIRPDEGTGPDQTPHVEQLRPLAPPPGKKGKDNPETQQSGEVVRLGSNKYLNHTVNIEKLPIPLVRFPGLKQTIPDREVICNGWTEAISEFAPSDTAAVIPEKTHVPYLMGVILKDAEFVGRTRETAIQNGQPAFGRQRSSSHIATLGPMFVEDCDGDVLALEERIRLFGAAAVIYTSHSYGHVKEGKPEPSRGGRVLLIGDRKLAKEEYRLAWHAINHLLGGEFDPAGNSPSLCYGGYARRDESSPCKRIIIEGAALNYDALIELGYSLSEKTEYRATWTSKTAPERRRSLTEYLERVKLMGAVRPPDDYEDWYVAAGAFKREFPNDMEMAFALFDAYAACSKEYAGTETCSKKFDQVNIEYKGDKLPVTLGMLHTRANRRAIGVVEALYGPQEAADAFKHLPPDKELGAGIPKQEPPKGGEFVSPGSVKPEDGLTALEYLLYCHSEKSIEGLHIPPHILKQAKKRTEERSRRVTLNGRTLAPPWNGEDAHTSLIELGEALIASGVSLFKVDKLLVVADDPMSDPALAQAIRNAYEYKGQPGAPDDPALGGVHLIPLETDDLRILFDKHVAVEKTIRTKEGGTFKRIISHGFNAKTTLEGPDRQGLKHLLKHDLPARLREVRGVVTAPVMPNLPTTTRPEDLLRGNAGYILTKPGYDPASRLFLAPNGIVEPVPDNPTAEDIVAATNLLRLPFYDFPFASPSEGIDAEVSRSVAMFGTQIAANRRVLPLAPGIGFTSHGEGMSAGKSLLAKLLTTTATGTKPIPRALATNYDEQQKQLTTYLLVGDGSLFLDNIVAGVRLDSSALATIQTAEFYGGRLLGVIKNVTVNTQVMVTFTGISLNMSGEIATRNLLCYLDTGLERPQDRSSNGFKIPNLEDWIVENRQKIVAAVHTLTRAYLAECHKHGGTPPAVAARRCVEGSRSGGQVEFLRDVFLWAFSDMPDPFLGYIASSEASSAREEKAQLLNLLDQHMQIAAGQPRAPAWATAEPALEPTDVKYVLWEAAFLTRWKCLSTELRLQCFQTADYLQARLEAWRRVKDAMVRRLGKPHVRSGRTKFTTKDIIRMADSDSELKAALGVTMPKTQDLNAITLGIWLKKFVVRAPIDKLMLRHSKDRRGFASFWIERIAHPSNITSSSKPGS